jgi:ParB family chromosome partitioning protein
MSAQAPDLKDSVVAKLVDERHAEWEADLPLGNDAALWNYLTVLDQGSRLVLLRIASASASTRCMRR